MGSSRMALGLTSPAGNAHTHPQEGHGAIFQLRATAIRTLMLQCLACSWPRQRWMLRQNGMTASYPQTANQAFTLGWNRYTMISTGMMMLMPSMRKSLNPPVRMVEITVIPMLRNP